MQIWRSTIFVVYLHNDKGGQRCPPFFVSFLLKTSSNIGFFSFEVRKISFEEKSFSFEEGFFCSIFVKILYNI